MHLTEPALCPAGGGRSSRLRRRAAPIVATAVVLVTGMAFCLFWAPVVEHRAGWIAPGDIWGAYRSRPLRRLGRPGRRVRGRHGIGDLPRSAAPVGTGGRPHLARSGCRRASPTPCRIRPRGSILGPVEILISCTALFACDALAERLGVSRRGRWVLSIAEGVLVWNTSALWGHPEDALAFALALYALLGALDDRWNRAGWLFGAAVVTQPVVLLMAPVLLGLAGKERASAFVFRALSPSVFLLATPLIAEFRTTAHALVDQPNFPNIDHRTPWTSLAPPLGRHGTAV